MRGLSVLACVAVTFCCWGFYGPALHIGQELMGEGAAKSSFRPFICVGVAYFIIAVIYPVVVLRTKGEKGSWTLSGAMWSLGGGIAGALGALGIVIAFKFKGDPVYVMPLVFGCAPVINTFVTMIMARMLKEATVPFYIGILVVAIGAAGVMYFKPNPHSHTSDDATIGQKDEGTVTESEGPKPSESRQRIANSMMIAFGIALTALCWGSYGPVLHKGQAKMSGSRLRPYFCVGLAYFLIAVIIPVALMPVFPEQGGWTFNGTFWSLMAGAFGAIGALGIIYAFNFGGKPILVMPLVFGMAPVINTFTVFTVGNKWGAVESPFYISLVLVIAGAITVLRTAPKGPLPPPAVKDGSASDKTTPLDTVRIENQKERFS
jgi:hypothetical protein